MSPDALLDEMVAQQRLKLLALARRLNPRVTAEDLLQPHDVPELSRDPAFNYEDGILAGLLSAQMALRADLNNS